MEQGNQQDRIAYLVGPVLTDMGAGFYMVHRAGVKRLTYFVQENILPIDEDEAFTMTEVKDDGKPGRVFTAPTVYSDDVSYDITQTYEGSYDYCRCGSIKAACERRCPICRIERKERRQAFAKKVIAAYKRNLRKQAKAAKRAAKQAKRQAEEQAEFDRLRSRPVVQREAGPSLVGQAVTAIKGWFARPSEEPVQMELPLIME